MKKKAISSFLTRNIREFALIAMILFVAAFVQIRTEGVFLTCCGRHPFCSWFPWA